MIKWTKLPAPDCFTQDPNLIYVIPCDEGIQILRSGLFCFAKNITVQEFMDNIKALDCHSCVSIEEIEKMIEELKKEKNK